MTVCFPPLIKPDGRFSRIRLSEFLYRIARLGQLGRQLVESIGVEEFLGRPALVFPRRIAVLAPQPLPKPMGDEVIHLPQSSDGSGPGQSNCPSHGSLG